MSFGTHNHIRICENKTENSVLRLNTKKKIHFLVRRQIEHSAQAAKKKVKYELYVYIVVVCHLRRFCCWIFSLLPLEIHYFLAIFICVKNKNKNCVRLSVLLSMDGYIFHLNLWSQSGSKDFVLLVSL